MNQYDTFATPENPQLSKLTEKFNSCFNRPPTCAASAPGRVNLIGEHTDYNDGFVFPMAIEKQTLILAAKRSDNKVKIISTSQPDTAEFIINKSITQDNPAWSNYVRGVLAGCIEKNMNIPGFDAIIGTTIPVGAGLSSSASIEVATATLAEKLCGQTIDKVEKALLCQKAEHDFAGVPCGIMDQFICTLAQKDAAMLLDCKTHETVMAPFNDSSISILIIDSNVKHELNDGEYAARRQQCNSAAKALKVASLRNATVDILDKAKLDDILRRRARHVITENMRTKTAAKAIKQNNWKEMGELMTASHNSLKDDFEVSCAELDILVELALEHGKEIVFGSRMTGGGFGGCTVSLVKADSAEKIAKKILAAYKDKTGIEAGAFVTRPADGAKGFNI